MVLLVLSGPAALLKKPANRGTNAGRRGTSRWLAIRRLFETGRETAICYTSHNTYVALSARQLWQSCRGQDRIALEVATKGRVRDIWFR